MEDKRRVPPKKAQDNAKKGLALRKEYGRGGTSVGVARARDISNGSVLSETTIKRMAQFNRHRDNYRPDKKEPDGGDTAGTIAWLLWGGTEGIDWAIKLSDEITNSKKSDNVNKSFKKLTSFNLKSVTVDDPDYFYFEGYASVFNIVDSDNEIITSTAFDESLKSYKPKCHVQHSMRGIEGLPVGSFTDISFDDKGIYVKAKLPKADKRNADVIIPQIKAGNLDSMSVGFQAQDFFIDNNGRRNFTKCYLYEISLVSIPANPMATIQAFKGFSSKLDLPFADRDYKINTDNAIKRIREFSDSIDGPSEDYKKYFFYFDEKEEDNFNSYKFPFVDIIEGKAYIVPSAITSIASDFESGIVDVNISDSKKNKIIKSINEMYKMMSEKFNDENFLSPLTEKNIDSIQSVTDIEKHLKFKGFSNKDAKHLISVMKKVLSDQREVEDNLKKKQCEFANSVKELSDFISKKEIQNQIQTLILKIQK